MNNIDFVSRNMLVPQSLLLGQGLIRTGDEISTPWYLAGGAATPIQANKFIGVGSFEAAKTNLITPGTLDLINGTAIPTWASETGALFNVAAGQYLRTGITSLNGNITALVCFTVNEPSAGEATVFGSYGTHQFFVQRHNLSNALVFGGDAVTNIVDGGIINGTHTLAIAGNHAYLDGVDVTTTLLIVASDLEIYLGALNYADSGIQACGSYITHWAFWSSVLTAPQVAAIHGKVIAEATNP